ncbi:MAG TPA: hypothetical protein VFS08_04245, partial [Gemmatimonadaceae bacterium]|nr:hypothetical protein [Gemmatimonadaceae bacterium]
MQAPRLVFDSSLGELIPRLRQLTDSPAAPVVDLSVLHDFPAAYSSSAVVLVGVRRQAGYGPRDVIRRARHALPCAALFVIDQGRHLSPGERRQLAIAGIDEIIRLDHAPGRQRLAELVRRRTRVQAPERALYQAAATPLAPAVGALVRWVLRNAYFRPSIEHVAAVFQVTSKTITRTLARHGAPRFGVLKELGILLYAREMEIRYGLTRSEAARRLG